MIKSKAVVLNLTKRTALAVLTLALASLSALQSPAHAATTEIIIATGDDKSLYHQMGVALCNYINKNQQTHDMHCTPQTSLGSVDNANKLREGAVQFAIMQSDVQFYALKGYGPFKANGPDPKLRSIFSLHQEPFTIVARADSNINSFDDLRGKRVSIGIVGSGQRTTMQLLMRMKGWTKGDLAKVSGLSPRLQTAAICANEIDAMVTMAGHPDDALKETVASCPVNLVSVTGPVVDQLVEKLPYYYPMSISGDTYSRSTLSVRTFGVNATLVTSSKTPDAVVKQLLQAFFNNFTNFKFTHAAFVKLAIKDMASIGLTAPLHPSAQLYFTKADSLSNLLSTPTAPQQ